MAIAQVMKKLGLGSNGKDDARSVLDLIQLSRKGLPKTTIVKLEKVLSVKPKELAPLLWISNKTISRYKSGSHTLNAAVSERILRLAMVSQRCEEVFEDKKFCNDWLKSESVALGGKTPLDLMKSDFGIDLVLTELTRIEHGVVS
jgi:putative toxin-antitoxin system antitoxin component (TIGR02293 family)